MTNPEKLEALIHRAGQYHLQKMVISEDPIQYLYNEVFGETK